MGSTPDRPIALAAFGRIVGVTEGAVRGATRTGRLERSLVIIRGRLKIGNLPLALQEWEANRDEAKARS